MVRNPAFNRTAQKMKNKLSIPLIVLTAVCVLAAVALIQRYWSHSRASVKTETADILPKFKTDDVAEFRLSWRNVASTIKKQNGKWIVAERGLPADPKKAAAFIEAVQTIRPLKVITPLDDKVTLRLRTFSEGFGTAVPGVRVELKNSEGKIITDLVMGRGHFLPDDTTPDDQRVPSGRYISVRGKDGKPVVFLTPSVFEDFHPVPGSWLKVPVFEHISAAMSVIWRQLPMGKTVWSISRRDPRQAFEDSTGGLRPLSRDALSSLFSALSYRYIQDAFPRSHYKNIDHAFGELIVSDCYGVTRSLIFHRLKGDKSKVVFSLNARIYRRVKVPGIEPEKIVSNFLSAGKDVYYEMPVQLFDMLTAAPYDVQKTKKNKK